MPTVWYDATVVRIEQITPRVRHFWLQLPDEIPFHFRAGQFVTLDLPLSDKRLERWRSYSIASAPTSEPTFELCISHMPGGKASTFLFENIQIGDKLRFKGPDGNFVLPLSLTMDLVLICTGTGIAPFRSMLLDLEQRGWTDQHIHLIYGSRTREDLLYTEELLELAERRKNFKYSAALSRIDEFPIEPWMSKGYVHQIYVNDYPSLTPDRRFLLCGWTNMIDEAVVNLIINMGYSREQVSYELYG